MVRCASYLTAGVDLGFPKGNAKLGASIAEAKRCGNRLIQPVAQYEKHTQK